MRRQASRPDLLVIVLLICVCGKTSAISHALDCQGTIDREGSFFFKESDPDPSRICLSMIKAPHDRRVEVGVQPVEVPCDGDPQMAFIDGINLNNDFFPSLSDSPGSVSERMQVLCSHPRAPFHLVANQNVASLLFRSTKKGRGFKMVVRFVPNPTPCNVIAPQPNATGLVRLSNFGHQRNCSLLVLHPTEFSIIDSCVANGKATCPKSKDFFEIRSGLSVDPLLQTVIKTDSCALTTARRLTGYKGPLSTSSPCYASVVRLVSSGAFNNVVVVKHRPMDLRLADQQCPAQ